MHNIDKYHVYVVMNLKYRSEQFNRGSFSLNYMDISSVVSDFLTDVLNLVFDHFNSMSSHRNSSTELRVVISRGLCFGDDTIAFKGDKR